MMGIILFYFCLRDVRLYTGNNTGVMGGMYMM